MKFGEVKTLVYTVAGPVYRSCWHVSYTRSTQWSQACLDLIYETDITDSLTSTFNIMMKHNHVYWRVANEPVHHHGLRDLSQVLRCASIRTTYYQGRMVLSDRLAALFHHPEKNTNTRNTCLWYKIYFQRVTQVFSVTFFCIITKAEKNVLPSDNLS